MIKKNKIEGCGLLPQHTCWHLASDLDWFYCLTGSSQTDLDLAFSVTFKGQMLSIMKTKVSHHTCRWSMRSPHEWATALHKSIYLLHNIWKIETYLFEGTFFHKVELSIEWANICVSHDHHHTLQKGTKGTYFWTCIRLIVSRKVGLFSFLYWCRWMAFVHSMLFFVIGFVSILSVLSSQLVLFDKE